MVNYAAIGGHRRKSAQTALTPQSRPIPGREPEMVQNAAGGFTFKIDAFAATYRFMIIGTEGGSYYVGENKFTKDALKQVQKALSEDPRRVTDMAIEVLREGRAFKQDPVLFVLALCASFGVDLKEKDPLYVEALAVRKYALSSAIFAIRQSTQLFHFMKFVQEMRGWGRGLRAAFANWYVNMPEDKLALQVTKYKNRDGVTHQDILRLAHPKWPALKEATRAEKGRSAILQYAARPEDSKFFDASYREKVLGKKPGAGTTDAMKFIAAAEELLHVEGTGKAAVSKAVRLIRDYGLTHEMVPSELKNSPEVWAALAESMPVIATLRNLGKMTQVGVISRLSATEKVIVDRLGDTEAIRKSRAHPIQFLIAFRQYAAGRGAKGSLVWVPTPMIKDALDAAFPLAFGNVEPSGARLAVAVDNSSSMTMHSVMGLEGWKSAELAGAMAMIHLRTEPNSVFMTYTTEARWSDKISARSSIGDAMKVLMSNYTPNGTDTSSPYRLLMRDRLDVDAVVSYSDNETWAGYGHSAQWHRDYTKSLGHPVRFVNCATSVNMSTDVDPGNPYMLEMTGFDASAPRAISEFLGGRL
jgi:60 kDa SS-A/Ro ribonucleoprotein